MKRAEPEHVDKLGNRVHVNDVVAVVHQNNLIIAKIIKIYPKMVRIKEFKTIRFRYDTGEHNKYSSEMVRISEADAVIYILKNT